jgi:hypothetical protein
MIESNSLFQFSKQSRKLFFQNGKTSNFENLQLIGKLEYDKLFSSQW